MSYTEADIRIEALKELDASPTGTLTTAELITLLEARLSPTGQDAEILDDRSDTYFSQKVRNLVSHKDQSTSLQTRGLAIYNGDNESWTITDKGRAEVAALT
ncbi:hypothetical protein ROA7450_00790 [Roseovarius albus]|uniref:EF-hand domain-containing protein n=1 Tax=Roseovarius albus TaxID=1247867 RepID=A0A1X6YIP0_9RHOB|nr:hypothetical protein [Roseovarius albus]SLN21740.1 hypothetical protein ROA7450_00790 [Roseovarius albus]